MDRLCERPGCSDPASVAYGMRPADLVFWLDTLGDEDDQNTHGVLCRRHADSMVVPRNWTLDDIRDPELHLFRPPAKSGGAKKAKRTSSRRRRTDQLELDVADADATELAEDDGTEVDDAAVDDAAVEVGGDAGASDPGVDSAAESADEGGAVAAEPDDDGDGDPVEPWTPAFDADDDLGGLLAAHSPLLARAFRGADRPRSS